jgi:hypothetical protein
MQLDVYVTQDVQTGIWTVDVPQLWIIGHKAAGQLSCILDSLVPNEDDYSVSIIEDEWND